MTDLDPIQPRPADRSLARRAFLRSTAQVGVAAGGLALLSACGSDSTDSTATPTPTPTSTDTSAIIDADALNIALNLTYLQAQFTAFATTGANISAIADSATHPGGGAALLTGTGTQGTVTGGRAATITDTSLQQYARELAADDLAHLGFLRSALGSQAVAMPALNIDGSATGAFTKAAQLAGYVAAGATFDPYASDLNFLLAAYLFRDAAVTALKGATTLITNTLYLDAIAGIMQTQAYHAGFIRTALYTMGQGAAALQFSNLRDSLDGADDIDQGITGTDTRANISPTDTYGRVYTRTAGQLLNIAYLTNTAATSGGFFPSGANGAIKTAAASDIA